MRTEAVHAVTERMAGRGRAIDVDDVGGSVVPVDGAYPAEAGLEERGRGMVTAPPQRDRAVGPLGAFGNDACPADAGHVTVPYQQEHGRARAYAERSCCAVIGVPPRLVRARPSGRAIAGRRCDTTALRRASGEPAMVDAWPRWAPLGRGAAMLPPRGPDGRPRLRSGPYWPLAVPACRCYRQFVWSCSVRLSLLLMRIAKRGLVPVLVGERLVEIEQRRSDRFGPAP